MLVKLARDPNRFIATIQIGITPTGRLRCRVALVTIVLMFVSVVQMVLGELVPKNLAIASPG